MSRIALTGGAYQARSLVASAQRQVNLYSEPMPQTQGEPAPAATYPFPGLRLLGTLPQAPVRGIRQVTTGNVYVVAGSAVCLVAADWTATVIGTITAGISTPVSMADNGLTLVIVDGTGIGWTVDLASNAFGQVTDPKAVFRGGDRVDYLDGYFLFNVPGTPQFESSDFLALTFDPLWFANKNAYGDLLVTLVVAKRQIWLIGERTTEIWYNSGAPDFTFESWKNVLVDHGCAAKYSAAEIDNSVFWLAQDRQGEGIVIKGAGIEAERISTFAIEAEIAGYGTISDAVGYSYQFAGHQWYVLTFPTADKTWAYDISTKLWSELAWIDTNGREHRHRGNCAYLCRGTLVLGDWQNGNLYALDSSVYTDMGRPIKRVRSFPHLLADGKRVFYRQLLADMAVGAGKSDHYITHPGGPVLREQGGDLLREDGTPLMNEVAGQPADPLVFLRWSDTRGASWGNPVAASLGGKGAYKTSIQYQRLGMARDRVFELSWSTPGATALLGAFIDAHPAGS